MKGPVLGDCISLHFEFEMKMVIHIFLQFLRGNKRVSNQKPVVRVENTEKNVSLSFSVFILESYSTFLNKKNQSENINPLSVEQ